MESMLIDNNCCQPSTIANVPHLDLEKFFTQGGGFEHKRRRLGSPAHLTRLLPLQKCWRGSVGGGRRRRRGEREEEGEWIWPAADLAAALPQVGNPKLSLLLTYTSFKVQRGEIRSMLPVAILGIWDMKFLACKQISLKIPQISNSPLSVLTLTFRV